MAAISQLLPYSKRRQSVVSFLPTSKFQDINDDFFKNETLAVILEGMSGSGKSEIALTLALNHENKLKADENTNYIIVMVNSSSEDLLRNDLQSFCSELKLNTLEISSASCFKNIYEALNKDPYAGTKKLFIFDDMNLQESNTESMLASTVLACLPFLANGDSRHKGNWKFIVTTKHGYGEDLTRLKSAAKIFKIEGFSEKDTLEFFKGSQLDENNLKKLHILMGGSPLGLSIAKKELKRRDQNAEDYIKHVEECAERYLDVQGRDAGKQGNVIASVAKSLRPLLKERGKDNDSDLLRCILFFNENNITEQLLLSCMEIIDPKLNAHILTDAVSSFCSKVLDLFIATEGENNKKKNGLTLHQLAMKALRLLVRHDDPIEVQQIDCRRALTALCRCLDLDGRFHDKFSLRTSAHALSVAQFLKEKIDQQPTFCDVTIKIMHIQLLCAISYADMRSRGSVDKGQSRLEEARDSMCVLVCGQDFAKLKETAGKDTESVGIPQKVGERLYNGCKKLMPDAAYKEYVGNVSLYQRLTDRDVGMLSLEQDTLRNDHICETRVLAKLREDGNALKQDEMEKIFAAEFTASIFFLLARLHGFTMEESVETLRDSIKYAQIALAMYGLIEKEHGVTILNKVMLRRSEELMCRMKLLANQPQMQEAHEILKEFQTLSCLTGKAFEYGLLRSKLESDRYHQMLCHEGMLRAHGLLYRAGDTSSFTKGNELFERCKDYCNEEKRKDSCLSNLYQHYADFLHNCEQDEKATTMLVQAVKCLGKAKAIQNTQVDNPRPEILEGRFTELCDKMGKYANTFGYHIELTPEDVTYLEELCALCK